MGCISMRTRKGYKRDTPEFKELVIMQIREEIEAPSVCSNHNYSTCGLSIPLATSTLSKSTVFTMTTIRRIKTK